MRDIKFRAWDIQQNRMWEWDELKNEPAILAEALENRYPYFKPIMQFTGLEDKNGKGIYEGDIVSDGKNKYVVAFYMGAWRLKINVNGDDWWKALYRYTANCEVVGDIYRNKELLEGK